LSNIFILLIINSLPEIFLVCSTLTKKTCMKPKTSHQNNENFALTTQFPDIWITVGKSQNFHGKITFTIRSNIQKNPKKEMKIFGVAT